MNGQNRVSIQREGASEQLLRVFSVLDAIYQSKKITSKKITSFELTKTQAGYQLLPKIDSEKLPPIKSVELDIYGVGFLLASHLCAAGPEDKQSVPEDEQNACDSLQPQLDIFPIPKSYTLQTQGKALSTVSASGTEADMYLQDKTALAHAERLQRRRRIFYWIVGVTALTLLVAALTHFGNRPHVAADALLQAHLKTVAAYPVTRRNLTREITLSAELKPYKSVNVYAKISGYLKDISVDYGSHVQASDVLAHLEVPEQEADLARTDASYRLAKLDYDRLRSVVHAEPGLIAASDVDKARAAYEVAADQRAQASSMLDYSVISAPFAGVVTKRYVDPGALIQQGTASTTQAEPIVRIADDYHLRLVVETPESIVPNIHVGTPAEIKIQATGEIIRGSVARYSYDVHEETRTMHTEVDIPNADLHLKPGMYAYVTIVLASRQNVPAVPTQALSTGEIPNVWVVDEHDQLRRQKVNVGLQTPNWVEITQGLLPGERVLIGSRNALAVGMKVRPKVIQQVSE